MRGFSSTASNQDTVAAQYPTPYHLFMREPAWCPPIGYTVRSGDSVAALIICPILAMTSFIASMSAAVGRTATFAMVSSMITRMIGFTPGLVMVLLSTWSVVTTLGVLLPMLTAVLMAPLCSISTIPCLVGRIAHSMRKRATVTFMSTRMSFVGLDRVVSSSIVVISRVKNRGTVVPMSLSVARLIVSLTFVAVILACLVSYVDEFTSQFEVSLHERTGCVT